MWIEVHTNLLRHRKTKNLARALQIEPFIAIGHLVSLWTNVMEQSESGDITKWSKEDIADYACYKGDVDKFYNALLNNGDGWIDEIDKKEGKRVIHDWWDYAGRYLTSKYKTSNPDKLEYIKSIYRPPKDALKTPHLANLANLANLAISYVDFENKVYETWNKLVNKFPTLSKIEKISETRRKHLKKRFESQHFRENFDKVIDLIPQSKFLLGENKTGWRVSFDWLIINDTNYIKVLEGKYLDKKTDLLSKWEAK